MHPSHVAAWARVLRHTSPRPLAVAACVCRDWAAAVHYLRARDVADGTEGVALLACTAAAATELRAQFQYTHASSGAAADAEDVCGGGCSCEGDVCDTELCECSRREEPRDVLSQPAEVPQLECGPACSCGTRCPNRATQQRITVPLSLRHTRDRGWAVVCDVALPPGRFVCTYAGEVISRDEASRRLSAQDASGAGNYIMVLREHAGERTFTTCVDPSRVGNVGRFLNHACDGGNLELRAVRAAGWPVPRPSFFTRRRVNVGEELKYAYGTASSGARGNRTCHCRTAACVGFLPFDNVL